MQTILFGAMNLFSGGGNKVYGAISEYGNAKRDFGRTVKTEMENLECLGYGAKAFTISMVETALRVSERKVSADKIQQIILFRVNLYFRCRLSCCPVWKETLKALKEQGQVSSGSGYERRLVGSGT